jgi:pyruvate/2-oxoglutarate dehydrogenase complex dihydrolipoamide dehydrogenase (E3) component
VPAGVEVDFGAVMARMREIRARISRNDSARRFRDLGVDVFLGEARFLDGRTLEVGGRTLRFKKAVIATGARAAVPPIPGLEEAGFLTNETVFTLTERPRRLAVIGGGPIGSELAQAFRRLGSDVLLIEMGPHILGREDADAAAIVERQFEKEGIRLRLRSALARVERSAEGKVLHLGSGEAAAVDEILIGVGRAPNVEGLGLEAAGVRYDARTGIEVNDRLETSAANIYAAGDVAMSWKFTHAADFAARIVIQNALFPGPKARLSSLTMPWCTYTDPEVAHVGMYGHEAAARGIEIDTFEVALSDVDRALADGEEEGFVKVHVRKGSDRILGATIVARHAGEMISELSVAMKAGAGLGAIARTIHPYPTQAEAIRKAGDLYQKTRLTPFRRQALSRWFQWTR